MLRQALAIAMSVLLSAPVWAISSPLGTMVNGIGTNVAGSTVTDGSTLYSGDTLSVERDGNASILLAGGSRARLTGDSAARLSRDGSAIALELVRGKMEFTSSGKSPVEGRVADVTFRPENPSETSVGLMKMLGSNHTVLYATKGDWIVTTAQDGHSLILRPGEHIEGLLTAVAQSQSQSPDTAPGQQKKKKKRKMAVIWIGTALAGVVTGVGLAFGMSECNTYSGPYCTMSTTSPTNQLPQ